MGYRIQYTTEGHTRTELYRTPFPLRTLLALFLLLISISMRLLWPTGTQLLSNYLLPIDPSQTEVAFLSMVEDLRQGESVQNALTAFCIDILDEAS